MLPMRSFFAVVVICISIATVEPSGPLKNNHEVLGITRAATFEDIQNAFQKLSKMYQDRRREGDPPVPALVEIQHAYEAISNKDMQQDALRFVDYWGYVSPLEDDMALRRFLEFQPSGSSRLRMAVVVDSHSLEEDNSMHFEVYATAVKFGHRVRVGQISQSDAKAPDGQPDEFIKSLNIRRAPAVVLMDPITRIHKVRYNLDGVSNEVEKILNGDSGTEDKLGWLQEYDADAYKSRCESSEDNAVECSTIFLFATSPELEQRREDLVTTAKPFYNACRATDDGGNVACFWLRRGRAPYWDDLLQEKFKLGAVDAVAVAVKKQSGQMSLATKVISGGSTDQVIGWFNDVLDGKEITQALNAVPPTPPRTLRVTDEPAEDPTSKMFRKALFHCGCVFYAECRAHQKYEDELFLRLHTLLQQYGLYEYYVQLLGPQTDWTVVAGVGILMLFFFFVTCKKICCGRRGAKKRTEEEAAEKAEFFFKVTLTKQQDGETLGMDLKSHDAGGVGINSIAEGKLVDRVNAAEPRLERRIRQGDRIACVSGVVDGNPTVAKKRDDMLPLLKGKECCLTVARTVFSSRDATTQRMVGTCHLEKIPFHGNVELGPVDGGTPFDVEIKSLGPAIIQWNEEKTQQGACYSQRLEVGDRIISVAGNVNVLVPPVDQPENTDVMFVRWRTAKSITARTIEINMERAEDERLGMHIKPRQFEPKQNEILEVVPEGLAAKWNSNPSNPQILKGDRIASANGKTDAEGIRLGLREKSVKICFERWVGDSSEAAPSPSGLARLTTNDLLQEQSAFHDNRPTPAAPMPSPIPPAYEAPKAGVTAPSVSSSPPPAIPAPPKAPAQPRTVKSPAVPVAGTGNAFPWLPVLLTMAVGITAIVGGLSDDSMATKRRIPVEARTYLSQINSELHPEVAAVLLLLGLLLGVNFIRNEFLENYSPGRGAGVIQQLCGAAMASTFLGFGSFFLLAWSGVYA